MTFYKIINKYDDIILIKNALCDSLNIDTEYFLENGICGIDSLVELCINRNRSLLCSINENDLDPDSILDYDLGISKNNDIVLSDINNSFLQTIKEYIVFS